MKTSFIISKVAEQYLQEKLGSAPKLPPSIIEKFKATSSFKEMNKAELIMSKTIQLKYKREFGVRNFAFFRFLSSVATVLTWWSYSDRYVQSSAYTNQKIVEE